MLILLQFSVAVARLRSKSQTFLVCNYKKFLETQEGSRTNYAETYHPKLLSDQNGSYVWLILSPVADFSHHDTFLLIRSLTLKVLAGASVCQASQHLKIKSTLWILDLKKVR